MAESNIRPDFDQEIIDIAKYVSEYKEASQTAYDTAYYCLMDSIGCALLAHRFPECIKLLGPIASDEWVLHGARVDGESD